MIWWIANPAHIRDHGCRCFKELDIPPPSSATPIRLVYIRVSNMAMRRPRSGVIELLGLAVGGRIMKMLRREQLFAAPKLVSRAEERLARGIAAVSAARERATKIAQQSAAQPRLRPTALHRRRLERLKECLHLRSERQQDQHLSLRLDANRDAVEMKRRGSFLSKLRGFA